MRIADTVRTTALLAGSVIATTALVLASWPTHAPAPARAHHVGRCTATHPARQVEYRDVLLRAWDKLHPCVAQEADAQIELALDVSTGHVSRVDVRSINGKLISSDVLQCVRLAVKPLEFLPVVDHTVQLTLRLR